MFTDFESWIPIISTQKVSKRYFVFIMRYTSLKLLRNYPKLASATTLNTIDYKSIVTDDAI